MDRLATILRTLARIDLENLTTHVMALDAGASPECSFVLNLIATLELTRDTAQVLQRFMPATEGATTP